MLILPVTERILTVTDGCIREALYAFALFAITK